MRTEEEKRLIDAGYLMDGPNPNAPEERARFIVLECGPIHAGTACQSNGNIAIVGGIPHICLWNPNKQGDLIGQSVDGVHPKFISLPGGVKMIDQDKPWTDRFPSAKVEALGPLGVLEEIDDESKKNGVIERSQVITRDGIRVLNEKIRTSDGCEYERTFLEWMDASKKVSIESSLLHEVISLRKKLRSIL